MATPTSVLSTPVELDYAHTLPGILKALASIETEVEKFGVLGTDDGGDFGFRGESKLINLNDVIAESKNWEGLAVSCYAHPLKDYVYLYFWQSGGINHVSAEVPQSAATFISDEENITWLIQFMLTIAKQTGSQACAYGPRFDDSFFTSLDRVQIHAWFENGELFSLGFPSVITISDSLIDAQVVYNNFENNKTSKRSKCFISVLGYSVISIL